jgi:hypothetical protein
VRGQLPARLEPGRLASAPPTAPEFESLRTGAPPTAPEIESLRSGALPALPALRLCEGDAAVKDLRRRLARDPDLAPQPPPRSARTPRTRVAHWVGGWPFALTMAAIALGTLLMALPLPEALRAGPTVLPARLPVAGQKEPANEMPALAVALADASARWSNAEQLADGRPVRLDPMPRKEDRVAAPAEPSDPARATRPLDAQDLAVLEHFLKNGDILSARILLRRAAGGGNAQAALELGMTFDPDFLAARGVRGFPPDPAEARAWYERAAALGLAEASRHLERLAPK